MQILRGLIFSFFLISCSVSKKAYLSRSIASSGEVVGPSCFKEVTSILTSTQKELFQVSKLFNRFERNHLTHIDIGKYQSYLSLLKSGESLDGSIDELDHEAILAMVTHSRKKVFNNADGIFSLSAKEAKKLKSSLDKLLIQKSADRELLSRFQKLKKFLFFWKKKEGITKANISEAIEEINNILYPMDIGVFKNVDGNKLYRHLTVKELTGYGLEGFFKKHDLLVQSGVENFFKNRKTKLSFTVLLNLPTFMGWPPLYVPKDLHKNLPEDLIQKIIRNGYKNSEAEIESFLKSSAIPVEKAKKVRGYIVAGVLIWDLYLLSEFIHDYKKEQDELEAQRERLKRAEEIEVSIQGKLDDMENTLSKFEEEEFEGNCQLIKVCLDVTDGVIDDSIVSECRVDFDFDNSCELDNSAFLSN